MDHLTRGPRILQGPTPTWRTQVRTHFPLPGAAAYVLATGVVLGAGLVQALLRSWW